MRIILTHNTALNYLRMQQDGVHRCTTCFDENDHARGWLRPCSREVEELGIAPDQTLHVSTDRGCRQGNTPGMVFHEVRPQDLPPRSFVLASKDIAVVSPELCFVQLAATVPFVSLVSVGYELCGGYSLAIGTERGFLDRKPLTSVAALESYLDQVPGMYGVKAARRAVAYILDGSASPMETALAMLLTLPTFWGGYGFELPQMNGTVRVPLPLRGDIGVPALHCDLLWPERHVAVEYDSDRYHTGTERIARDAKRRNNLNRLGYEVIVATRQQVLSARGFEEVAALLALLLGRRLRIRRKDFERRHRELRLALFSRERLIL